MSINIINAVIDAAMKSSGCSRDKYYQKMGPKPLRTKRVICFVIMNEMGVSYSHIARRFERNAKAVQIQSRTMKAQIKIYADLKEIYDTVKKDMGTGAPGSASHAVE